MVEQALGSRAQGPQFNPSSSKNKTNSEDILLSLLLSFDSAVVLNTIIKSYLGEKRIYLAYTSKSQLIIEGSQGKISIRNSRQKPWRNAVC